MTATQVAAPSMARMAGLLELALQRLDGIEGILEAVDESAESELTIARHELGESRELAAWMATELEKEFSGQVARVAKEQVDTLIAQRGLTRGRAGIVDPLENGSTGLLANELVRLLGKSLGIRVAQVTDWIEALKVEPGELRMGMNGIQTIKVLDFERQYTVEAWCDQETGGKLGVDVVSFALRQTWQDKYVATPERRFNAMVELTFGGGNGRDVSSYSAGILSRQAGAICGKVLFLVDRGNASGAMLRIVGLTNGTGVLATMDLMQIAADPRFLMTPCVHVRGAICEHFGLGPTVDNDFTVDYQAVIPGLPAGMSLPQGGGQAISVPQPQNQLPAGVTREMMDALTKATVADVSDQIKDLRQLDLTDDAKGQALRAGAADSLQQLKQHILDQDALKKKIAAAGGVHLPLPNPTGYGVLATWAQPSLPDSPNNSEPSESLPSESPDSKPLSPLSSTSSGDSLSPSTRKLKLVDNSTGDTSSTASNPATSPLSHENPSSGVIPSPASPSPVVVPPKALTPHEEVGAMVKAKSAAVNKQREREESSARIIFAYWQEVMGKHRAIYDAKRQTRIITRLRENKGDVGELLYAIDGAERDDFIMGRSTRSDGRKYNDIETVLRDRSQVEKFSEAVSEFRRGLPHHLLAAIEDKVHG